MPRIRFKRYDARPLLDQGIEPYAEIRRRVDRLKPSEGLVITTPFLPSPLIERLEGEGYAARAERTAEGSWVTHFWREQVGGAKP